MIIFCFTLNMKKKTVNTPIATHTHTFFSTSNCWLNVSRCNRFLLLLSCAVCNFSFAFIWLFFLCRFHLTANWDIFLLLFFFFFHLFCSFYFTFKLNSLICVCVSPSFYHCFKLFDAKFISFFVLTLFNAFQLF